MKLHFSSCNWTVITLHDSGRWSYYSKELSDEIRYLIKSRLTKSNCEVETEIAFKTVGNTVWNKDKGNHINIPESSKINQ